MDEKTQAKPIIERIINGEDVTPDEVSEFKRDVERLREVADKYWDAILNFPDLDKFSEWLDTLIKASSGTLAETLMQLAQLYSEVSEEHFSELESLLSGFCDAADNVCNDIADWLDPELSENVRDDARRDLQQHAADLREILNEIVGHGFDLDVEV